MGKYIVRDFYIANYHKDDKREYDAFINDKDDTSIKIDICAKGYGAKDLARLLGRYALEDLHFARLDEDTEDNDYITFAYEEGEDCRIVIATISIKNNQIIIDYNEDYLI